MPREKRQAQNQVIMRDVNSHVSAAAQRFQLPDSDEDWYFFCECGVDGCGSAVRATLADYQRVRSHPSTFLVAPGHQDPDREEVVARTDRFVVVRPAEVATASLVTS